MSAVPEVADGRALKEGDQEEEEADHGCCPHDNVDNPFVNLVHGNTQQEQANTDFCAYHGPAVGNVA